MGGLGQVLCISEVLLTCVWGGMAVRGSQGWDGSEEERGGGDFLLTLQVHSTLLVLGPLQTLIWPSFQARNAQEQLALMQQDRNQLAATVQYSKVQTAAVLPNLGYVHQHFIKTSMQVE